MNVSNATLTHAGVYWSARADLEAAYRAAKSPLEREAVQEQLEALDCKFDAENVSKQGIEPHKMTCDRCGKELLDSMGNWIDGAGNCVTCGDDLCLECAEDWVGGGDSCAKCALEFMVKEHTLLGASDEHFYLGREVVRLRVALKVYQSLSDDGAPDA